MRVVMSIVRVLVREVERRRRKRSSDVGEGGDGGREVGLVGVVRIREVCFVVEGEGECLAEIW